MCLLVFICSPIIITEYVCNNLLQFDTIKSIQTPARHRTLNLIFHFVHRNTVPEMCKDIRRSNI